ncbi:condensation domain-containing protein, partial [Janthinobacterium fluminis]
MTSNPPLRNFPDNFVVHLRQLAAERPDDTALIVVAEREGAVVDTAISYALLERRIRALAARLQAQFSLGERVLLLLDNDDHYVVSFFACLYAGLVAVPVFPPESARQQHLARLVGIATDAQASCILTTASILDMVGCGIDAFAGVTAIAADAVDPDGAQAWRSHAPQADDIAFLQYTSGSTSTPKGVIVTHGNLMANERAIERSMSVGAADIFVSWLPLYHDMGLIGGLLQPIHRGVPVGLMTPKFFLERPARWLEAISRLRGSVSGGPDFAFRLCLERVRENQLARLDLSSWRLAFSGAEPVRHDTLRDFIAHVGPAGFAAAAVYPCYGLAEATLLLTGGRRTAGLSACAFSADSLAQGRPQPAAGGTVLVACGSTVAEHRVEIVDPVTLEAAGAGRVGEIWASGASIAHGYWRRERDSADTFVTRRGQRWLRTGDLGFMQDEQLFITGRIKDLIILRGQNIYPQDIERAIEAEVAAARKGRVAAFAVPMPDGGEGVGVAVEVSRGLQKLVPVAALVDALSLVVAAVCREPASVLVLLNPGALPKTSSGKLQRGACRKGWLEHTLDAYAVYEHGKFVRGGAAEAADAPALDATQLALSGLWREVLKRGADAVFARDAHFLASGGSSLAAVQLAARVRERWDVDFAVRTVFEQPQLAAMAEAIGQLLASGARAPKSAMATLEPARRRLPLALSHAQQRQWFLWQLDPTGTAYHIGGALRYTGALDIDALRAGFDGLVARHESLRTVFRAGADGLAEQLIEPAGHFDLSVSDLRAVPAGEREARAARLADSVNAQPFDLSRAPLLRVALIRLGDEDNILVVVMHHIVSDGVSMQVLLEELGAHYRAHLAGAAPVLAGLPVQYVDYAAWQQGWLAGGERARQLAYWLQQLGGAQPVLALPADHARHAVAGYRAARHSVALPAHALEGLRQRAQAEGATLFMLLLAGFQVLLHRYTGQEDIRVGVPVANRHRVETEGLIGFFVNTQVLRNNMNGRTPLAQVLAQAREAALGAQSHQDLPFEQLVDALHPERSLSHSPLFQVMFNHLRADYRALAQLPGLEVRHYPLPDQAAQFELTLDSTEQADGQLDLRFTYAAELFEAASIERLAGDYLAVLAALLEGGGRTVGEVALLNGAEQARLEQWGVNERRYPDAEPVQRLFERQAALHPETQALAFGDVALSYAELNARANRLAHHLIGLGVRPET